MDEQKLPKALPLDELIERMVQGTGSDEQKRELESRLLANGEDRKTYLHHLNLHSALRRQFTYDEEAMVGEVEQAVGVQTAHAAPRATVPSVANWSWAVAAAAVVVLFATLYFQRPSEEQPIAKITGVSGTLQWTGDGGRVFHDPSVGTELAGGTVEGMAPGSWFALEFNDGSTVTISGNSVLTFSDRGQKMLYLKEGNISANVKTQPAGKPMLIYTRSAMLEVVGTQFEVEAGLAATMLNVSKGTVRVKRLSDGNEVDVHARHRVTAAAGRDMSPEPVPDSVSQWKSQLHLGPVGAFGEWLPGTEEEAARLGAIPYTTRWGKTIYTTAFGVSHGDKPPVVLQPASRFRVRGRLASVHNVYFGVTVRQASGEFAGKFQTIRPAAEFQDKQEFDVILDLRDFHLDPTLTDMKDRMPNAPFGLVVESIWSHTLYEPAGLEIAEAELLPPASGMSLQTAPTEPQQRPNMDIWTAASQGNLEVIRQHLASGTDVNATVTAPRIPVSGATPLHLAILADQVELAEFLIEKGANLVARAQDEHGGTPLHWAAALGRIEMAKRLMDAGADINAADNNGYTPLDATAYAPEYESEAKIKIADYLRKRGGLTAEERQTETTP